MTFSFLVNSFFGFRRTGVAGAGPFEGAVAGL
jgi:hypothetical protein